MSRMSRWKEKGCPRYFVKLPLTRKKWGALEYIGRYEQGLQHKAKADKKGDDNKAEEP